MVRSEWRADEPIEGPATLSAVGPGTAMVGGSGGRLIAVSYEELAGHRRMEGALPANCRPYQLGAGRPYATGLTKSIAFDGSDPEADFDRAFLATSGVRLPSGHWRVTAVADFVEGRDCSGPSHTLTAAW
ncbi:MAG TPA: hypothetical protein VF763_08770 [Candidatus Limnocylindrales bacterium]